LGVIGEPAKRAVPVLIKALSDEHWDVQAQAAHALKEIGIPEAMTAVEEFESRMRGA
jgi:HEAT repeat protein